MRECFLCTLQTKLNGYNNVIWFEWTRGVRCDAQRWTEWIRSPCTIQYDTQRETTKLRQRLKSVHFSSREEKRCPDGRSKVYCSISCRTNTWTDCKDTHFLYMSVRGSTSTSTSTSTLTSNLTKLLRQEHSNLTLNMAKYCTIRCRDGKGAGQESAGTA